jgi:hypothetical protein
MSVILWACGAMALTDDGLLSHSSSLPLDALDQLVRLHRETRQSDRLARFLAGAVHAAFLFMLMTTLVLVLARNHTIGRDFSWALLILIGVMGFLRCYIRTHAALSHPASFARTANALRLVLLYTGVAWGAGAFLVLPAQLGVPDVLFFMAIPSLALALIVTDAAGFTLFLVPAGLMVIAAALIRAFPHAMLDMSLILILQWGLFTGALLRHREPHPAALPQA